MTQLLKTRHPHEILQAAPVLAGGVPSRSALILPSYGSRIGSAMRIDLPGDDDAAEWAEAVVHLAHFVEADSAVVVLYPSTDIGTGPLPLRELAASLRRAASRSRLPLRGLFIVGEDSWGDFAHPKGPRGPIAELADPEARFDGRPQPGPLAAGTGAVPPQLDDAAGDAQRELVDALLAEEPAADPVAVAHAVIDKAPTRPTEREAAALATLVQVPVVRDEVLMTLLAGPEEGYLTREGAAEWHERGVSKRVEQEASLLMGVSGDVDLRRLRVALRVWRSVAERTIPEQLPAVLAVLAWLHWAAGETSSAAACADRALELDPEHSFATIVLSIVDSGHIPTWVSRKIRPSEGASL